jgi:type IV secretory pathway TrbL component
LTTLVGVFWFDFEWELMQITAILRIVMLACFLAILGCGVAGNMSSRGRIVIRVFVAAFVLNEILLLYSRVMNNSLLSSDDQAFWSLAEISYSALGMFVPFVLFLTTIVITNPED